MFSNCSGINLEINHKKINFKILKCLEIRQNTSKNAVDQRRNHSELRNYFELNDSKSITYQNF